MATTAPPAPPKTFKLLDLCHEVLRDRPDLHDPHEIADEVIARIPDPHLREALEQSLHTYTVNVAEHPVPPSPSPSSSGAQSALQTVPPSTGNPPVNAGKAFFQRSRKNVLAAKFCGADRWKTLGEATVEDLRFGAEVRRAHGKASIEVGDRCEELADYMDAHGHKKVADVPIARVVAAKLV